MGFECFVGDCINGRVLIGYCTAYFAPEKNYICRYEIDLPYEKIRF